jgi:5-methylcytosine-specific restriction endonuclease McrA
MVDIGSLSYLCTQPLDGCRGMCVIRQLPQDADAIQRWLAALPVQLEYRGEGLPSITERIFNALLKSERRSPSPSERQRILSEQDNRCYLCGGIFDGLNDVEFDHVTPLRQTVRGQRQIFAAACSSCHLEKTQMESRQDRTLESRFAPHVWQEYVQSPRPPALVFESHRGDEHGT